MPENASAPGEGGDAGETAASGRLSPVKDTTKRPLLPDPGETYCRHCYHLVVRAGHRSRCLARRGKAP